VNWVFAGFAALGVLGLDTWLIIKVIDWCFQPLQDHGARPSHERGEVLTRTDEL
jgi:hypothetical protein